MKRQHLLMAAGVVASAALAVFGDRAPSGSATVEAAPHAASAQPQAKRKRAPMILALQPRAGLIAHDYPKEPPALFGIPAASQAAAEAAPPMAAAASEEPAMPFTYLGKKFENGKWEVYLAIGDKTYFAREGSVLDDTYVVNAIRPPVLTLTFIPKKQVMSLIIGGEG